MVEQILDTETESDKIPLRRSREIRTAFGAGCHAQALLAQLARTPADERRAPLRGMCLAPKDKCYTADLLTEGGSLVFEGFQPDYDATNGRP